MREEEWMVFILIFCKIFNIVSHNILIEKWMKYGLHKWSVQWTEIWLNFCSQNVVMSSTKSIWRPVTSGICPGVNTDAFWPVFSGGFHLFLADLSPQRGSHRNKNWKLVIDTSCTSNCGPVVTLLLKSLFELLELSQKSTWHTLLLIIILGAAQCSWYAPGLTGAYVEEQQALTAGLRDGKMSEASPQCPRSKCLGRSLCQRMGVSVPCRWEPLAAITCHLLPVLLPGSEPTGSEGLLDRTSCSSSAKKTLTLFCSQRSAGGSRASLLLAAVTSFQPSPSEESSLWNLVSTDSWLLLFSLPLRF